MAPNYRKIIALSIFLILVSGSVFAKVLTLDDCIELALKKNQDVISARNQEKTAKAGVWQAFGAFLPSVTLSGSASQTHTERYSYADTGFAFGLTSFDTLIVPPDTLLIAPFETQFEAGGVSKSYSVGMSAGLTVFNGGQNIFNYLGAKAGRRYYSYQVEASEQGLIYTVKVYYFAYLKSLDKREISREAVKRGEEQYKLAKSKYEVGSASKSDVLKAKVQYGNDKLGLIAAENSVKIARANLAYLIGLDVNADVEFSAEFEGKEYDGTELDAFKYGMANHPGLLASENYLMATKYDVRSAFGRYLPTLTVDLNKNWSNSSWSKLKDFRSQDGQWTLSTRLSLPIFQNFSRKRAMSSAKAAYNNAQAQHYYTRNNIALGIKQAYLEITRVKEALNVAGENVLAAEEDMSLVREKYNLGAATILELLDAQVSLITAQTSQIEAEFDYHLAVAELENAMGVR